MLREIPVSGLIVATILAAATLIVTTTAMVGTQPAQASEVLPSPEICVEAQEVTSEGWNNSAERKVVVTNGCPAPVLILYLGRLFHQYTEMGVAQFFMGPGMSLMSNRQGQTFEERLVETMKNEEHCEQYGDPNSCRTDILQPGQQTMRAAQYAGSVDLLRRFDWAVCAQYHPLSLDAASGPRECDVNPAFFLPNTQEVRGRLSCPASQPLESCFRGR